MSRTAVMHLTASLDAGGAERVAVNLVNLLPRDRYDVCLCTTRRDGALAHAVAPDVRRLRLERRHAADLGALRRLVADIRRHDVSLLHAHATSLFVAAAAAACPPHPAVIWHDHFGSSETRERPAWLYGPAARRLAGVIAVNERLCDWARARLRLPAERVWYLPNFVRREPPAAPGPLPGTRGGRIVAVANFRPQKDHPTLLRAMASIVRAAPGAHLLLVGAERDPAYRRQLVEAIGAGGLGGHVTVLGERQDVGAILQACDVGVLSSSSEGLPLALLEYGEAGLPVVATGVGQVPEVLDGGRAGRLVPAGSPDALAAAVLALLADEALRRDLAGRLHARIQSTYSPEAALAQLDAIYCTALGRRDRAA